MSFGIYLHIPFCGRKCAYCDFYSVPAHRDRMDRYVAALVTEIGRRAGEAAGESARTLYAGGGTPSLLTPVHWEKILKALRSSYDLGLEESTIEANPAGLSRAYLAELVSLGFDRLSLGVQSFDDDELRLLGRRHDARQAREAALRARAAGFDNLSLDLIYGLPGQTREGWARSVDGALSLRPEHISAYELTLGPETPLYRSVSRGRLPLLQDDVTASLYLDLVDRLEAAGLAGYEISNFARPGRTCRHNLNYWRRGTYLGFGPGAHSFDGEARYSNRPDLEGYLGRLDGGGLPERITEKAGPEAARREQLMLGLRVRDGVPMTCLGPEAGARARELVDAGYAVVEEDCLRLTPDGALIMNEIAVRLL